MQRNGNAQIFFDSCDRRTVDNESVSLLIRVVSFSSVAFPRTHSMICFNHGHTLVEEVGLSRWRQKAIRRSEWLRIDDQSRIASNHTESGSVSSNGVRWCCCLRKNWMLSWLDTTSTDNVSERRSAWAKIWSINELWVKRLRRYSGAMNYPSASLKKFFFRSMISRRGSLSLLDAGRSSTTSSVRKNPWCVRTSVLWYGSLM